MCAHIDCYLKDFAKLDPATGKPKALLLLAVLDLIAAKKINREFVEITPELAAAYRERWQRYMGEVPCPDMADPFLALDQEPYWELAPKPGVSPAAPKIDSLESLKEVCLGARMDRELFRLCLMEPLRRRLQSCLEQKVTDLFSLQ